MQQIADEEFQYLGLGTFPSVCRLRVFTVENAPTVIIATKLPHNLGTSITNAAQDIATQAYKWLERPEHGIIFIEHHEKQRGECHAQEHFALATFKHSYGGRFSGPEWHNITKEEVGRLINKALP